MNSVKLTNDLLKVIAAQLADLAYSIDSESFTRVFNSVPEDVRTALAWHLAVEFSMRLDVK
ncbi:hypothetical protein ACIA2T_19750 [Amycolatopsis japonica]|uniref:hypothetical protein n=1 Tax=Amycolatopsis japonica TaxID=208439 RepID=UPI0037BAE695